MAAACALALVSLQGQAASGTVDIIISARSNAYPVEMGETTITASGGSGTLTFARSTGRPFVEGAGATVQFASFSKRTPSGLELQADGVATFSADDSLLLLLERHAGDPGAAGEGTLRLMGGTGRFVGVSGDCKYRMDDSPGEWQVTAE